MHVCMCVDNTMNIHVLYIVYMYVHVNVRSTLKHSCTCIYAHLQVHNTVLYEQLYCMCTVHETQTRIHNTNSTQTQNHMHAVNANTHNTFSKPAITHRTHVHCTYNHSHVRTYIYAIYLHSTL